MERDYIYIDDAVHATIKILESKTNDKVFNIGSGVGTSINKLISIISDVVGENFYPLYKPDNIIRIKKITLDISRISSQTCWKPNISLYDGIKNTWTWIANI
jgi:UDP-glucose 4-epimerase